MAAVATYTKAGAKATTAAKLDSSVFAVEVKNHQLLKDAYLTYLANGRLAQPKTKNRGDVSGGGKKPWRQKGTGRARFGSSRNPIWRGGGVAFGPTGQENHTLNMNQKAKHTALRQALSLAAEEGKIRIIETFACPDGKVKPTLNLLKKIDAENRVLIVVSKKDTLVEQATRNLKDVKAVTANYLNVYDLLNADTVVISSESLEVINQWLGDKK